MNENISYNNENRESIDFLSFAYDLLHRLKSFWWVVVLTTTVCGLIFYYNSSSSVTTTYRAEATVSVELVNGGAAANRNTAEQMGNIFPHILTSSALNEIIASDLGLRSVPGTIRVSCISGTNLLTISVTGSNGERVYAVLQSVLRNYPEVAQFVVGQTTLTVVDDSGVPSPTTNASTVGGSVKKGLVIGFLIGAVLLVLYTMSTRTIRNEEELRSLLNVTCLGVLPTYKKKRRNSTSYSEINILYDNSSNSDYNEALRLTRTRIDRRLTDKKVIMVTSSIPGEGKSSIAANLAVSMARKGKRVILIDCDLRNPSQGKIFRLKAKYPGLAAVLQGRANLSEAIIEIKDHDEPIGLTLMPGSETSIKSVEILASDAMGNLLEKLKEKADVIILDTPPSAMLVDAMILVRHVDGVVYVVMSDFARRSYILRGMEELSTSGAEVLGCILNGGHAHAKGYGYYGYKYGSYKYSDYKSASYYRPKKSE